MIALYTNTLSNLYNVPEKFPVELLPPGDFLAVFEVPHNTLLINVSVSFSDHLYLFGFWFNGKDH